MATTEEIQKKYNEEKRAKILQLQTTLSSRTGQAAKQSALVKNGVSIINNVFTPEEFVSPDILGISGDGNRIFIFKSIREGVVKKNSSQEEPFGFIALESKCIVTDFNDKSVTVSYSIEEKSYLFLPSNSGTTGIRILTVPGTITQIKITDTERGFESLRKELSSFIYPTANIVINDKFEKHLDAINIILVDNNKLPPLDTLPILSYSIFTLGDFNLIFPKPDGLEPSLPQPNVNVPGGNGITVPPTPEVPTTTGTGIPEVPTTTTGTGISTTETQPNGSARKYLSIEAIKDDDPVVPTETTSSKILSLRYLDDSETSTDGYSSSSEINQIRTDTAQSRATEPPISPVSEQNEDVLEKEAEELRKRTEAQRKAEESDAVVKEETKEKSSTRPAGSNPELSEGKAADIDKKNKPIPPDKIPPPSEKSNSQLPSFTVWVKKYGQPNGDEPFIYNRIGKKEVPYLPSEKDTTRVDEGVSSPEKYKSLFDYGQSLEKFFDGYVGRIKSPVDVALLCNTVYVGGFNKNIPYTFDEGSETQLVMIRAYRDPSKKGLLGTAPAFKKNVIEQKSGSKLEYLDKNWSENPYWCGLTVDFLLNSNKQYISDEIYLPIVGTSAVVKYFTTGIVNEKKNIILSNPSVNPPGGIEKAKNDEIGKVQKTIDDQRKKIKSIDTELKKLEKNKSNQIEKITKLQADNLVNPSDVGVSKEKSARAILDGFENSINAKNESRIQIQDEINQLEQKIKNIKNRPSSKYIENGMIAKFENGKHYKKNEGLTNEGKELWEQIKNWPGAYIVRRSPDGGHVELILHFGSDGRIFVIFGNSGYNETPTNRNGQKIDFKFYNNMYEFGGGGDVYVVKRGEKNPYTNGIGFTVKKTELYNEYVEKINSGDKKIDPRAYNNVLRNIMEI